MTNENDRAGAERLMMDEIKPGDVFEIRVTVLDHNLKIEEGWIIKAANTAWVIGTICEEHLAFGRRVARPLAIGDRVRFHGGLQEYVGYVGTLLVLDKRRAGVDWGKDNYSWPLLSDLERAPAPDTKERTS